MTDCIDLHVHTTASDGTLTPAQCAALAAELGLRAIAITDHDTAAGAAEALSLSGESGVEIIPGIEISADYHGHGIHILGYFIDPAAPALEEVLAHVVAERERRNRRIAALMQADGLPVSVDAMAETYPGTVLGRPHFARELMALGLCSSVDEGFRRFLSKGCPYYQAREYLPMDSAFRVIRQAGGKAVMAHPYQYRLTEAERFSLILQLKSLGLAGLECHYAAYSAQKRAALCQLAAGLSLCVTGGTDFHGAAKPGLALGSGYGDLAVPYALLEGLKHA